MSSSEVPKATSSNPPRLQVAMLVHPKMVMLDLIGPMTVFNLASCDLHLVWKTKLAVRTELGIPITPTITFADCPKLLDVLFVPGGLEGTVDAMEDPDVVRFLSEAGRNARYVTSACTGSLLLGAAGLLHGYRATSHWSVRDEHLRILGAIPTNERVVVDRNRLTGGGVTAGIDFGLTLAGMLFGQGEAEAIQLLMEYAPEPPFTAGTPEHAPSAALERITHMRAPAIDRALQAVTRAAASLKR